MGDWVDKALLETIGREACEADARVILDAVYGWYIEELSEGELVARLRRSFSVSRDKVLAQTNSDGGANGTEKAE